MRIHIFFIIASLTLCWGSAQARGVSAYRYASESYDKAARRSSKLKKYEPEHLGFSSPQDVKAPLSELDTLKIPRIASVQALESEFKYIRDNRFLKTEDPEFLRRITWLYPDDGCYARAEMVTQLLEKHKFPSPKKLFVFGELQATTRNSPRGVVHWWYHVAVTYRVNDQIYILDPALNSSNIMTLSEWNHAVGGDDTYVEYAICSAETFDTDYDCTHPKKISRESAEREQRTFLGEEWERLKDLGRDPFRELGEHPPWLNFTLTDEFNNKPTPLY